MLFPKKVTAVAASFVAAISLASAAQDPAPTAGQSLVVPGQIEWLEKSNVSALKEGVIEQIEPQVGRRVVKGEEIGTLNDKLAELQETKAKIASNNQGEMLKAKAQKKQAQSSLARIQRLEKKGIGYVSLDEKEKAEAEVAVADSLCVAAEENHNLAVADYNLAKRAREEHRILAPFTGVVIERHKNPGEAVRSSEAVVSIGRTDKLKFVGWLPLNVALKVKPNDRVEFRPIIDGGDYTIEKSKYVGKVMSVGPETNTQRETEVCVIAEIENPEDPDSPESGLRQGLKGELSVSLTANPTKVANAKARR